MKAQNSIREMNEFYNYFNSIYMQDGTGDPPPGDGSSDPPDIPPEDPDPTPDPEPPGKF